MNTQQTQSPIPPDAPTTNNLAEDVQASPEPPPSQEQKLWDDAHGVATLLDAEERNAPLETGLTRKFQKQWNVLHRTKRDKLPENGELGRSTMLAIRRVLQTKRP